MSGPILSFDINRDRSRNSNNKVNNRNNNLIQVYFGSSDRATLNVISRGLSTNTIKIYKCIKSNTYIVIKIENNRIYRVVGPKLIGILINNIDKEWQLICSYKNMNEVEIRRLNVKYGIK